MDKNINLTVLIDRLNNKIAELNIIISKDPDNQEKINELNTLLSDKELLYKGSTDDVNKIMSKYGEF